MMDVEPLIISELERMLPLPEARRADWADVLRRAGAHGGWRGRLVFGVPAGRRRWRPVLVAAAVAVGLALAAVAIAAGFGAFDGIGAAQHPQTTADRLAPKDLPPECGSAPAAVDFPFCHLILSSARVLRTVPGGGKLWVVTDTHGDLCVILERGAASCSTGLTPSRPTTITAGRENEQTPWMSWGITLDSVAAVSFPVGGQEVQVPVKDNVWFYAGDRVGNLAAMTIHFKDGSTEGLQGYTTPSGGK